MNQEKRAAFLARYSQASTLKKEGQCTEAEALFQKLIANPNDIECAADYQLFGSAYFHLGEIAFQANEKEHAEEYLETCLHLYPEHQRAQEYIRTLREGTERASATEVLVSREERSWRQSLGRLYVEKWKRWWQWQEKYHRDTMRDACHFKERNDLFAFIAATYVSTGPISYLEFGVHTGNSFTWWLAHHADRKSRFYGFDSFRGLPEFWIRYPKGRFDMSGTPPHIDDVRGRFIVGPFHKTLIPFLSTFRRRGKVIVHLDADIYSATLFVLMNVNRILQPGDIFLFDELSSAVDEFRAFLDYETACVRHCRLIGATENRLRSAVEVV